MRKVANEIEDPSICEDGFTSFLVNHVVRIRKGERISGKLAELLNPINASSFHEFRLPANAQVELHYHDFDEYWLLVTPQ